MTLCPASDGSGLMVPMVVVDVVSTVCETGADGLLWRLKASPENVAFNVRAPIVFSTNVQPPAVAATLQLLTPSVTVTLPLGAGPPAADGTTVKVTLNGAPTPDGFGVWAVIVVVVL